MKKRLIVRSSRCPENHPCPSIRICPTKALKQNGFLAPTVDYNQCISCGKCVTYCPYGVFELV